MTQDTWLSQGERGTVWVIGLTYRLAALLGRRLMRLVVSVIALYYRLFDRRAVAASRDWLTRVHGQPPGFWSVYRHLRVFAQVTLDRVFLLTGRTQGMVFTRTGVEHLHRQLETGQGAMLVGAHLGSYDAMRAGGVADGVPIQILGYFKNARQINALLNSLNPEQAAKVIHLGDDPVGCTVRAKASIDEGHLVAVLADRVGLNERAIKARFLGQEAYFSSGPFLLASVLKCPVYLVFGIYSEPNRYDLHCEPLTDRVVIARKDRQRHLEEVVQEFATRVESYARSAPYSWFNFYDFWSSRDSEETT